jgi:tetratricopeptide (TPR) repeat protein
MKGRFLVFPLVVLMALSLAGQTLRWRHRATASRLLREVEILSVAAFQAGQAPPQLMYKNLEALRKAEPLDPVEVGIPIARGTQYLFLSTPEPAVRAYEDAMALEPRPEGYLNLGRAQWYSGRAEEARRSFARAIQLDSRIANEIPAEAR